MRAKRLVAALIGMLGVALALAPLETQAAAANVASKTGPPPAALQAAIDQIVADGVPGVIALERRGQDVWHVASGVQNLQTGTRIRTYDQFRIGSVTKSFVSTVILQLVGEGRLSLDDSVERWLPGQVPNGANITVRELLNHTSGLFDYLNDGDPTVLLPYFVQRDWDFIWQPAQLLQIATAHPANFPPGTQWRYSNTGYIVLGLIIQAVTHRDPAHEIERRIIQPLDLEHTSFPTTDADLDGAYTHGYLTNVPAGLGFPKTFDITTFSPSVAWTAGAMVSSVDDLARFHRALFTGTLLRPAQMAELETTVPISVGVDYGLGVFELQSPCGPAWGHDGDIFGYATISLTSPDGSRQAVLSLNSDRFLSQQTVIDYNGALLTAFCGPTGADARAATSLHTMPAMPTGLDGRMPVN